jgi:hypothetical protein
MFSIFLIGIHIVSGNNSPIKRGNSSEGLNTKNYFLGNECTVWGYNILNLTQLRESLGKILQKLVDKKTMDFLFYYLNTRG